jgi:two-component system OmpR family response regulator
MSADYPKLRVLLVEDTILVADQLRELLQNTERDPEILVAVTEDDALTQIDAFEPHVIILDLKLRQGTGFGVLRSLATAADKPVIIVLTSYALPQYREFAQLIGADFFLDKAFDFSTLSQIIESIPCSESDQRTPFTKH